MMKQKLCALLAGLFVLSCQAQTPIIKEVEKIHVSTPEGTVPRLPYRMLITLQDGTQEWKQVKWMNYSRATEELQSNPLQYPVGKNYTVKGFLLGDESTDNGFPVEAQVTVSAQNWDTPKQMRAQPLPLNMVELTGDNRLTHNRDMDVRQLLALDITQQLYNYRDTYGLSTEGYTPPDGWDSPTTKLKGHGTGHYLSALAFAFAGTNDRTLKDQLRNRISRMLNEMRACQERTFVYDEQLGRYREARDYAPEEELENMKGTWEAFDNYKKDYAHYGYGYLNAIPAAHPVLIEKYSPYNNEQWVWAPYYTIHKQLAGLIDIALLIDQEDLKEKALAIARDMGLWVWNRLHYRTYVKTDGTKEDRQARPGNRYEMWNMYIAGEVGGMAESLSRLSEMVTDSTQKAHLLEAANYFDSPAFFEPLSKNVDDIRTRHANQHIPMITGALRSYNGNKNPYYYNLAQNFWNLIQGRYIYAMGGVGNGEMFRQPYSQMISMNTNLESDRERNMYPNPNINETCCAYNLAKLTKDLNCYDPDNAAYMDYYEQVLYNQLVGSVHPEHWGVTYQYAVGMNAQKEFDSDTPQSSCCGGTGAENHVKYQEAAYFAGKDTLWVGLYLPSVAHWNNVTITQDCKWPAEYSRMTFSGGSFCLKLRVPYWATKGFDVKLNGKSMQQTYLPSSYVEIPQRQWNEKDVVEIIMPFQTHIFYGPDKMDIAATGKNETRTSFEPAWLGTLMYGPLAMSTPDIQHWNDADFTLKENLSNIHPLGASEGNGYNGNLYTLSLSTLNGEINFQPDYYQTGHSTHYLRLHLENDRKAKNSGVLDKSNLELYIQLAQDRVKEQEEWNALTQKIPQFAPWAPFGYSRMKKQLEQSEQVLQEQNSSQQIINKAASSLSVIINSMRPGNLAEPEDLQELLSLSTSLKNISDKSTQLRSALDYADTVISYVNDGSGTPDMIEKAIDRLKNAH